MRRQSRHIHELPDWPSFGWDQQSLASVLATVRHQQGRLIGRMEGLGFPLQQEAVLQTLTEDVVKSSEIEGERLDQSQVRSSIARRLGMNVGGVDVVDREVEGVVEMMLDATCNYDQPLTAERLSGWHASLFPTGRSGMRKLRVGTWRDDNTGPMQVVSGPIGRERVHFEAPAAGRLEREIRAFLHWFNEDGGRTGVDDVLRAGLAHLWFVTIHPFDDGNGRIARAIADMVLARSEHSAQRFYSMSAQIRHERNDYYEILERTQKGTLDVTPWMEWFLGCLGRAIDGAPTTLASVLKKARFWQTVRDVPINGRQRLVLNRVLDGFEGRLTTSKWVTIATCSSDTALRDIVDLVERGVLIRNPGAGRNTSYSLAEVR
ncbi:MAG TPA: Fic family protein [Gemmatimonadaceae bacterium]|nr:Fic family protein [Gemmatimonadaceae bacterium]